MWLLTLWVYLFTVWNLILNFDVNRPRSSLVSSGHEKSLYKWLFLWKVCEYPRVLSHVPLKYLFPWQSYRVYFTALTCKGLGGDEKCSIWDEEGWAGHTYCLIIWKFNGESSVSTVSILFWQKHFSRVKQSTMCIEDRCHRGLNHDVKDWTRRLMISGAIPTWSRAEFLDFIED